MYTTTSNIEAKLGTKLTPDQVKYFNDVLSDAIDGYIDRVTGTSFLAAEVDAYVDGTATNLLIIPTTTGIASVHMLNDDGTETLVNSAAYAPYPRGSATTYALRNLQGDWEEGNENYKITGGADTKVPPEIVDIATELAINRINENSNNYKSERVGDWAVTYTDNDGSLSPDSMNRLMQFRRLSRSI